MTDDIKRVTLKPVDKDRFELTEPYEYRGIQIPAGYKTNGANIPRIFWSIFPPNSPEYLSAIVVHDFLCDEAEGSHNPHERHLKIIKPEPSTNSATTALTSEVCERHKALNFYKFADEILKEMLLALGVNKLKACIFYYSCRAYHIIRYEIDLKKFQKWISAINLKKYIKNLKGGK